MNNKGNLFIISGPSGSGKDTVLGEVFRRFPDLKFSISVITREKRKGEADTGKYRFVSTAEFEKMLRNGELLEHNVYVGNYYGTPKKYVEDCINSGDDIMVEVDVNGARQIREKLPEAISIFICPPSLEVLKQRLEGRGTDSAKSLEIRLSEALREIENAPEYDYIVFNDQLADAVADTCGIIASARLKACKNTDAIRKILDNNK